MAKKKEDTPPRGASGKKPTKPAPESRDKLPALAALIREQPKIKAAPQPKAARKPKRKPMKRGPYAKFTLNFLDQVPEDRFVVEPGQILPLEDVKRNYVKWVIRQLKGDKPAAADACGISLRTIYNMFSDERQGPEPSPA